MPAMATSSAVLTLAPHVVARSSRLVTPDDPHREELRAPAVRVAHRLARAVDLVRVGAAHDLAGSLREAEQSGRTDRVGAEHAARGIHWQLAADRRLAGFGELPALALGHEPEVLQPHGLEPRERHVDLGRVDLLERVADAGLLPQRGRGLLPGLRVDLVATGVGRRLGAHRGGVDPGGTA